MSIKEVLKNLLIIFSGACFTATYAMGLVFASFVLKDPVLTLLPIIGMIFWHYMTEEEPKKKKANKQ